MESTLKIRSIRVCSYKILPEHQGGYVKFYVMVEGTTRFMHPLCLQSTNFPSFKFSTRYSVLLNFHLELKDLFTESDLPQFPKKKWFGCRTESFLTKRILHLNDYFSQILENPLINSSEPVMRLISPNRSLNLSIIGAPNVGKQHLIELFLNKPEEQKTSDSIYTQKLVKIVPIDLLVDEKLYRIACLEIRSFQGKEEQESQFLNESLADKHAAVFLYRERGTDGHVVACKLFEKRKGSFPCILVNFEDARVTNECCVKTNLDAFNVFVELIHEIEKI